MKNKKRSKATARAVAQKHTLPAVEIRRSILLLILIGLVIYFASLLNGFVWDDYPQILRNTLVHTIGNFFQFFTQSTFDSGGSERVTGLYYRPIMSVAYALLYSFMGPNPLYFHLIQVMLHSTNSILVFIFFRRFFSNNASFFLAIFFLIHPLQVEAVAYIAAMQDTLFFFFGMIGLLILQKNRFQTNHYVLLFSSFLLSFLSKETGIAFLLSGIVFTWLFNKNKFKQVLLIGVNVSVVYLLLRFGIANIQNANWSIAPIFYAPLATRLVNIPLIMLYYIKAFFFPVSISTHHFWIIQKPSLVDFYIPVFFCLFFLSAISGTGYYLYSRKKKELLPFLFFTFWFTCGMLLHLQLIPLDMTVADRWFYFTSVGAFAMTYFFIKSILNIKEDILVNILLWTVLAIMSIRTVIRITNWRDDLTLYQHDITITRKNFVLDNAYATELIKIGEFERAKQYVKDSIKEKAYYANLNNMAIILVSERKTPEAKYYLEQAAKDAVNSTVYENYSSFLVAYGGLEEADVFTKRAIKKFPRNSRLWLNMAKIKYLQKDKSSAVIAAKNAYDFSGSEEIKSFYIQLANDKPVKIQREIIEY